MCIEYYAPSTHTHTQARARDWFCASKRQTRVSFRFVHIHRTVVVGRRRRIHICEFIYRECARGASAHCVYRYIMKKDIRKRS